MKHFLLCVSILLSNTTLLSDEITPQEESLGEVVVRHLRMQNIQFVDITWSDALGEIKTLTIPLSKLKSGIDNKMFFDGSSMKGFQTIDNSDLCLNVDLSTLSIFPWMLDGIASARFFCDIINADETPYENDPRGILKNIITEADTIGYSLCAGTEIEFFLFKKEDETLTVLDNKGYCDAQSNAQMKAFEEKLLYTLIHLGIDPEKIHHEVAPGQFEVVIGHTDPLTLADRIQLIKHTIQILAEEKGYIAVFMPKPVKGINGSGMHIHVSIKKDDKNIFFDESKENYLSDEARSFIANLLYRTPEINLLLNFDINSSKRLVPGYEAPIFLCCGAKNRSAAIRVPEVSTHALKKTNGAPVRIELRWPDASCNPYLALAALFKAGLEGIENKTASVDFINKNIYRMSDKEREALNIKILPSSLEESICFFEHSKFARDLVGPSLHKALIDLKRDELYEYDMIYNDPLDITSWEIAHSTGLNITKINH